MEENYLLHNINMFHSLLLQYEQENITQKFEDEEEAMYISTVF